MKPSIGWLMVLVAVDAAVIRANVNRSVFEWIAVPPIVIAIHVALYTFIRRRDVGRWFWCGFSACGLLTTLSLSWYSQDPGGFIRVFWKPYFQVVGELLNRLPVELVIRIENEIWPAVVAVGIYTAIPQFTMALIGGMLTLLIARSYLNHYGQVVDVS